MGKQKKGADQMRWILAFFRCSHPKLSRVWSKVYVDDGGLCYVTCTDCGKRWEYDWATMRQGREIPKVEEVKL